VIAALILVNFTVSLRRIIVNTGAAWSLVGENFEKVAKKDPLIADWLDEELERASEFEDLEGREFFPTIKIHQGYTRILRNAFLWELLVNMAISALMLALMLAATWLVALAGGVWTSAETNTWAVHLLLGLALMTPALGLALWLAFFVLERFAVLITIVITGLFLAIVPPLINYAITGEVGANVVLTSIITGAAGILSAAVAELVKKRPTAALAE
jgi:hypothetical protein